MDAISWVEWDAGPTAAQFGSLRFLFDPNRQQQPDFQIGIVKLPDHARQRCPDDDMWQTLATFVQADEPMLVTCYFGEKQRRWHQADRGCGTRVCGSSDRIAP